MVQEEAYLQWSDNEWEMRKMVKQKVEKSAEKSVEKSVIEKVGSWVEKTVEKSVIEKVWRWVASSVVLLALELEVLKADSRVELTVGLSADLKGYLSVIWMVEKTVVRSVVLME
jgi:hypothetical protein